MFCKGSKCIKSNWFPLKEKQYLVNSNFFREYITTNPAMIWVNESENVKFMHIYIIKISYVVTILQQLITIVS